MNKRIRTIISIVVIMAMTLSMVSCSTGGSKKKKKKDRDRDPVTTHSRRDEDETEPEETEPTTVETTVAPTETEPTIDIGDDDPIYEVTEEGWGRYVLPNGLTYPAEVATYEDVHPNHPNGTISGDEAVELLNTIEQEIISSAIDNYVDAVILYEDPAAMGLDISDVSWGEYGSDEEEDLAEARDIRDRLLTIDADSLEGQDRLFYDKLLYDTEESIYGSSFTAFKYYESEFNPLTGPQNDLFFIMTVLSFNTVEDAENYILLVQDIERYFGEICDFEEEKAEYGYALSPDTYEEIAETFDALLEQEDDCFLYETFAQRLDNISGLSEEDRDRLIAEHEEAMHEYMFPTMATCANRMRALENYDGVDLGLSQYDGGIAYYEWQVRILANSSSQTSSDYAQAIEARLDYIMGIYLDVMMSGDYSWMDEYSDHEYTVGDTSANLEYLATAIQGDFPALPNHDYFLMDVPEVFEDSFSPAAYLGYHLDNYNSNMIITNNANVDENFGTTCAHEGYPGHMFQSVYTREHCVHPYLYLFDSTGYVEGWATYVESYSYKYFTDTDSLAAQIVMIENDLNVLLGARWDIGIHCEDWSAQDCADYYASLFNNLISVSASDIESAYNLLLSDPCYYVKYGCGYMNTRNVIESMREAHPDATEQEIFAAYLESMPVTFEMIEANMDTVLAEN